MLGLGFAFWITPDIVRVRRTTREHVVYLRGRTLGVVTEGSQSAYFRAPSGCGKLFPSLMDFDRALASKDVRL